MSLGNIQLDPFFFEGLPRWRQVVIIHTGLFIKLLWRTKAANFYSPANVKKKIRSCELILTVALHRPVMGPQGAEAAQGCLPVMDTPLPTGKVFMKLDEMSLSVRS